MADTIVKSRRGYKRAKAGSPPPGAPREEIRAAEIGNTEQEIQANDSEPPIPGETFQVEEARSLAHARTEKWAKWRGGKKAKEAAAQSALTLLTILDGAIGISLGPECQMTADEKAMINEPLARIMARMTPETSEIIDRYTDPILLAFGFIMWGSRVFFVLQRQANEAKPKLVKPQPEYNPAKPIPIFQSVTSDPVLQSVASDMASGIPVEVAEALG